ncbi:helix-turn-helix transcriptional regulator, partial [Pseudomonas aeruginosa]|uniref:helix-turn-helix transcriptional regulator n=2 Tax=Pseudomonas aeruginosa TaxID=287 RepID=UPI003D296B14
DAMSALKAIRKQAGVTPTQLAERVGLTQAAIGHYETGRRKPGLSECRRIVAALNDLGAECTLAEAFPEPEHDSLAVSVQMAS